MSFGVTFVNFRNGQMELIPQAAIVSILVRHGCRVPELREGLNEVGLPHETEYYSPIGEFALLTVKDDEVTDFCLHRPQITTQCTTLLFSLVDDMELTMSPDHETDLYARAHILKEIPKEILTQFSNLVIVRQAEDCI